jgi:subtilisin family serine protease
MTIYQIMKLNLRTKRENPFDRASLFAERFYVDDLILDTNLLSRLKFFGGDTLSRITLANPCRDTLSITRNGDTILCDDYLWMKVKLNNDRSVIAATTFITALEQNSVEIVQPNFIYEMDAIPNDDYYLTLQKSLRSNFDVEQAWEYQTGSNKIKVAIIDDGVYYDHCDFKSGGHEKVIDGWNYYHNNQDYDLDGSHGTPVAGIIGAYTNKTCNSNTNGIAGISGGWNNDEGARLIGLKVGHGKVIKPNM